MYSKKINNFLTCINKLDLTQASKSDIQAMIKKWAASVGRKNEDEVLSIIIFFEILPKYPSLMNNPKHKAFLKFCENEVDEMPEISARQKLPRGR